MIQWMLAVGSLIPLPFLNPRCTSGTCLFTYRWILTWWILRMTWLASEMGAVVQYFEHSLAWPFFGIGMKTDLSSPVATVEFSKFHGILKAALQQHHLLAFEIARIPSTPPALFTVMFPKAHLTSHSSMFHVVSIGTTKFIKNCELVFQKLQQFVLNVGAKKLEAQSKV